MTKTVAIGDGPVVFFKGGVQVEVPLSEIYFENSVIGTTRTDLLPELQTWLAYLASRGRLNAGLEPSSTAFVVSAVQRGVAGNDIELRVAPKSAAGVVPVTVDVTVTETDQYQGLTIATLLNALGDQGVGGTRLGLVTVRSNPPASSAAAVVANASVPLVPGAAAGDPPTWTIAGTGAGAVKLQPRTPGAEFDAGTKTLAISDPVAATGTFTLTATWTRIVRDVDANNIGAKLAELGYLVVVAPPQGEAAITKVPRPGTVKLTGGSAPVAATAAIAVVLANS